MLVSFFGGLILWWSHSVVGSFHCGLILLLNWMLYAVSSVSLDYDYELG